MPVTSCGRFHSRILDIQDEVLSLHQSRLLSTKATTCRHHFVLQLIKKTKISSHTLYIAILYTGLTILSCSCCNCLDQSPLKKTLYIFFSLKPLVSFLQVWRIIILSCFILLFFFSGTQTIWNSPHPPSHFFFTIHFVLYIYYIRLLQVVKLTNRSKLKQT